MFYMNYTKLYCQIIFSAQAGVAERKRQHKLGRYFETHHILPKSLGGNNTPDNLVMLTGREHFICHWLLVKMYPAGSDAREKMVNALWRMRTPSENQPGRYINARTYDALRSEWAKLISDRMSRKQGGSLNSHYGTHWYTNAYDGKSIATALELTYPWVKGRWLFHGETEQLNPEIMRYVRQKGRCTQKHVNDVTAVHLLWDEFHAGSYTSLAAFASDKHVTYVAIRKRFAKFVPIFCTLSQHGVPFKSDNTLVGVYK